MDTSGKDIAIEAARRQRKTLLCVDDDVSVLKSLIRLFRGEDFRVLTASSTHDAFELLQIERVQLVMVDQRMPDMTGTQFLQQVKHRHPTLVRVILSGYSEVSTMLEAINRGEVYRFLCKPWENDELRTTIRQCFEHHALIDENRQLLAQLQRRNNTLKTFNERLHGVVELSTRTLEINQNLIEHLPLPLLGVSTEGLVVVVNTLAMRKVDQIVLGESVKGVFSLVIYRHIQQYLSASTPLGKSNCFCKKTQCHLQIVPLHHEDKLRGCFIILDKGE